MSVMSDQVERPTKYNIMGILTGTIIGILSSLIVMGLGVGFILAYRSNEQSRAKSRSLEIVSTSMSDMKASLTDAIMTTEILSEIMILHNYSLSIGEFLDTTTRLRSKHSIINAYEYAHGEDLPLILIDPITSPMFGLKIMSIPLQAKQVNKAIFNNTITVYGPIELIQGGVALIGINPIKYRNGTLYGVSLVLISLDKLFTIINLPNNYRYSISNVGGTFFNNTLSSDIDYVELKNDIYGEQWVTYVFSTNNWFIDPYIWIETLALLLCMLLTILLFILMFKSMCLGIYSKHMAIYFRNEFELEFRSRMKDLISSNTRTDVLTLSTSDNIIINAEGNIFKYLLYQPYELIGKTISSVLLSKRYIMDKNGHKLRCLYTLSDNKYTIIVDTITDDISQ